MVRQSRRVRHHPFGIDPFEWYVLSVSAGRRPLPSGDGAGGQGHRDQVSDGRDQEREVEVQGGAERDPTSRR